MDDQTTNEEIIKTDEAAAELETGNIEEPAVEVDDKEVEAFKKKALDEVSKRQELEAQNRILMQQLEQQRVAQANPVQRSSSLRRQAMQHLGINPEETPYLTTEEQLKIDELVDQARMAQVKQEMFYNQKQDFGEVVGKVNSIGQFVPSPYLQEAVKNNPELKGLDVAAASPAYAAYAYALAKQEQKIMALQSTGTELNALEKQKQLSNKLDPMSPAAVGGGSVSNGAARVDNMKPDEFDATYRKILNGEFD